MKTLFAGILAGIMLCALSLAQDATPSQSEGAAPQNQPSTAPTQSAQSSSAPVTGALRIAPGSIIPVQLTKTIDAKKAKTGDEVEAKVTQDLKTQNGEVVVPKDTKVLGHVTEAQARSKEQTESQVGIAFDRAVMKDRGDVPLPMSIQAIIAPPTLNPNNNNNAGGESPNQPAATSSPGAMPGGNSGRSTTGGGTPPQTPTSPPAGSESSSIAQAGANAHQPITGSTQGVVGISNLKLAPATNASEGSVVSSEKTNVKLESGTFMLLRVNQ